jgi:hypothetical protein
MGILPPFLTRVKVIVDPPLGPAYQAKLLNWIENTVFAVV